jgi:hypothetical protein
MTSTVRNISRAAVLAPVFAFFLMFAACSPSKDTRIAEDGVAMFHEQLDAELYHDIYSQASSDFQKAGNEASFIELFSTVHRKLGRVRNAKDQAASVKYTLTGTLVTLTYQTEFEGGPAIEYFTWRVGDQATLVRYRAESNALPALIVK